MSHVFLLAAISLASNLTAAGVDAWAVIDQGLRSGDMHRRRETLAALSTIEGNAEAVRRAEDALAHDKDARVRAAAAGALGEMKAAGAAPALRAALEDNGEVALAAAASLIKVGDASGRDTLIAILAGQRQPSPGTMTNIVREAQRRFKHPEQLVLMGAEGAAGTVFPPADMGLMAIQEAAPLRRNGSIGRAAAAAALAKDLDPYAVTLLEWALGDDSRAVRFEAAKSLGERGNAGSISKLAALLDDDHNGVRTMAAASIIRISARSRESGPDR